MRFNEYQEQAMETALYPEKYKILYPALGLANECGEVLGKIKKVLRDSNGDFADAETLKKIHSEIGDVMWYIAALCNDLGFDMNSVVEENLKKLQDRKQRNVLKGSGDYR